MASDIEFPLRKCRCTGECTYWSLNVGEHETEIDLHSEVVDLPKTASAVLVAYKGKRRSDSFAIRSTGTIEKIAEGICKTWRNRIRPYYRQGFRFVRFEYEGEGITK